jgi:restriction system protein
MMDKKNKKPTPDLISPHGGYRNLKSYQTAEIIYDATAVFCIAEGSMVSGTSKKSELKLIGIARASLEELLLDYYDFLRQRRLLLWEKSHPQAEAIRKLAWEKNRSYETYKTYVEASLPEVAANTLICLIHQANYLLDQQLRQLGKQFLEEGGFTEKLYQARQQVKRKQY